MVTPNLYDVFFGNNFADDMIPELEKAQNEYDKTVEKIALAYNMPYSDADALRCASNNEVVMSQYLGFIQGFKWAVYLFTGHTDNEEGIRA